jgi:uncharacterized protein YegL
LPSALETKITEIEEALKSYVSLLQEKNTNATCDSSCLTLDHYGCSGFTKKPESLKSLKNFGPGDGCRSCANEERQLVVDGSSYFTSAPLSKGYLFTKNRVSSFVAADVCFSYSTLNSKIALDSKKSLDNEDPASWRYIGFPSSVFRTFPAIVKTSCDTYDPRIRNWYLAATSTPKDVVIIIDASGSMARDGPAREKLMRETAQIIVDSLSPNDYFNVVTYSTEANFLDLDKKYLIPATAENKKKFKKMIANLGAKGDTNIVDGLELGLQAFKNKIPFSDEKPTSNCRKSAVFLTDGAKDPSQTKEMVLDAASKFQEEGIAVFTYSIGKSAYHFSARDYSCAAGGFWGPITEFGNIRSQLSNFFMYFEIQSSARATEPTIVWSE